MGGPPHPPLRPRHTEMPLSAVELCSQGGSDGKIVQGAYSRITTKHYTSGCVFPLFPASFSSFFLHYTRSKNAIGIVEVQLLPQSLDKNCFSDSSFNLFKNPAAPEVIGGSYQSSAGMEADYNRCCVFYHSPSGRK